MKNLLTMVFEYVWNLKPLEGHRTNIARTWLSVSGFLTAYQGAAISKEFASLPDVHPLILMVAGVGTGFFTAKIKKFAREHKEKKKAE